MNDDHIWHNTPNPESCVRICNAIHWLQKNNHLYSFFFAHFETLFCFIKPGFVNPSLLEEQGITLDKILEDEAVGMAFPVDAKYFDGFPLTTTQPNKDIEIQHPKQTTGTELRSLCQAKYGEKHLDVKAFPHLHPWGNGSWYQNCSVPFNAHLKMRLFDVRGTFAADPFYPFFKYDYITKVRFRIHNARRVVTVKGLTNSLSAGNVKETENPYGVYGTEVPRIIPGSKQYWRSFGLDLVSFVEQRGTPDFFLTLSAYDGWPQVQATLKHGWGAAPSDAHVHDLAGKIDDRQPVGYQPVASVLGAEKRYHWFMNILKADEGGPLGVVEDLVVKEY